MALIILLFALGVANFALHKAVLESGHPILAQLPGFYGFLGGRFSLALEFVILTGVMLMVDAGSPAWAWGYAVYSLANAGSAWLILSGRL